MGIVELVLLAVGLAMDAFAVSICKGLAMKGASSRAAVICGVWFGGFQALMPMVGFLLGSTFEKYVDAFAPWIAFVLLALIGANMIREVVKGDDEEATESLDIKTMFVMAVATSIDALAVGISFACVPPGVFEAGALINTVFAVCLIGVITFIISALGVKIGGQFGVRFKSKAQIAGGIILIALGLKILLEHLLKL